MHTEPALPEARRLGGRVLAPGLHISQVDAPRRAADTSPHGVALFVGFGALREPGHRAGVPGVMVDSATRFRSAVAVAEGSHLDAAVRGFFANGGHRCRIVPVEAAGSAAALRSVFRRDGPLDDIGDIDLVCVPDAVQPGFEAAQVRDIQSVALEHCAFMNDRFALLDSLPPRRPVAPRSSTGEPGDVAAAIAQARWHHSAVGALYFPWLRVDTTGRPVPPSGHVAGLVARTDRRVGVHKAPANEVLEGVLSVDPLDDRQHAALNDCAVNCIRSAPGRAIRVMGARTLSGHGDRRYVPVSRTFLALNAWLKTHMDDIVFETNDRARWQQVERRLTHYCLELMTAGALAADDAQAAFFVRCDAQNNSPGDVGAGRLVAEVGLAPIVPCEFVSVRITHDPDANRFTVNGL